MSADVRVAVLVGSVRAESVNRQVAELLRELAPAGVSLDIIDDLAGLPFYDQAIDGADAPAAAVALRSRVEAATHLLAVTPEHNGTLPAVLANAIDWISRPHGSGAIVGRPFGVLGVTPTQFGGKWSHEIALRAAQIAGGQPVEAASLSQSSRGVDVLADAEVRERYRAVLDTLVATEPRSAAA